MRASGFEQLQDDFRCPIQSSTDFGNDSLHLGQPRKGAPPVGRGQQHGSKTAIFAWALQGTEPLLLCPWGVNWDSKQVLTSTATFRGSGFARAAWDWEDLPFDQSCKPSTGPASRPGHASTWPGHVSSGAESCFLTIQSPLSPLISSKTSWTFLGGASGPPTPNQRPRPGWTRSSMLSGQPSLRQLFKNLFGQWVVVGKHKFRSGVDTHDIDIFFWKKWPSWNFKNGGTHLKARKASRFGTRLRFWYWKYVL